MNLYESKLIFLTVMFKGHKIQYIIHFDSIFNQYTGAHKNDGLTNILLSQLITENIRKMTRILAIQSHLVRKQIEQSKVFMITPMMMSKNLKPIVEQY